MNLLNIHPQLDDVLNDPDFWIMIESHLTLLRTKGNITGKMITEHQSFKYEGDFFGLLDDLALNKRYHQIVMRVNGYENSTDYKGDVKTLIIPDLNEINLLITLFQTRKN